MSSTLKIRPDIKTYANWFNSEIRKVLPRGKYTKFRYFCGLFKGSELANIKAVTVDEKRVVLHKTLRQIDNDDNYRDDIRDDIWYLAVKTKAGEMESFYNNDYDKCISDANESVNRVLMQLNHSVEFKANQACICIDAYDCSYFFFKVWF